MNADRVVLVVDDDEDIREALAGLLEDEGYVVGAAENGAAALAYLAGHDLPCVIVLDLMMPIMGGLEFRERQLSEPRIARVPVIVMSASDRGSEVATALRANAFVAKPTRIDKLLSTIAQLCASA